MKIMQRIENIEKELAELKADVKQEKPGLLIPEVGDGYYTITYGSTVYKARWTNLNDDLYRLYHNNVFQTKEEAERYNKIDQTIHLIAWEMKQKEPLDWDNEDQDKEEIYYDNSDGFIKKHHLHCFSKSLKALYGPKGFLEELRKYLSDDDLKWYIMRSN